jgi:hypothetical protein
LAARAAKKHSGLFTACSGETGTGLLYFCGLSRQKTGKIVFSRWQRPNKKNIRLWNPAL